MLTNPLTERKLEESLLEEQERPLMDDELGHCSLPILEEKVLTTEESLPEE